MSTAMKAWARRIGVGIAVSTLTLGLAQPTMATPTQSSAELAPELVTEVTSVWSEHNVAPVIQEELLKKMNKGQPVEAMLGGEPASIETNSEAGKKIEVHRYNDGSINIFEFQQPAEPVADLGGGVVRSVENCTQSGNRFSDCRVWGWFTAVVLSFDATYEIGMSEAQIISYTKPNVRCFPGIVCQTGVFHETRKRQSGTDPAQVSLSTAWSFAKIGGGGTTHLHLYVSDLSASTN